MSGASGSQSPSFGAAVARLSRFSRSTGRIATSLDLPAPLERLGFHRLTHSLIGGSSTLDLHTIPKAVTLGSDSDIAALTESSGPDGLEIFGTDRDRVRGVRVPGPTSVDNPSSPTGRLLAASQSGGTAAKVAHAPAPLGFVAGHIPTIVSKIRRARGQESDHYLRQANYRIELRDGASVAFIGPCPDRSLAPPWIVEANDPAEAVRQVAANVSRLCDVVLATVDANVPGGRTSSAGTHVSSAIDNLSDTAVKLYGSGHMVPIQIRQLRFEPGPDQFVQRVSCGENP